MKTDQKSEFWHNIIRAAEAEPRIATSIQGLSGFSHPVAAVGVDERRRRHGKRDDLKILSFLLSV